MYSFHLLIIFIIIVVVVIIIIIRDLREIIAHICHSAFTDEWEIVHSLFYQAGGFLKVTCIHVRG